MNNPFLTYPEGTCGFSGFTLPVQGCIYPQYYSQVCGVVLAPFGAPLPAAAWGTKAAWAGVIDNTAANKAKYLQGFGGFQVVNEAVHDLAQSRRLYTFEKTWRLTFKVTDLSDYSQDLERQFSRNNIRWNIWLETLGNRLIGGQKGLTPSFVTGRLNWAAGNTDREDIILTADFLLPQTPHFATVESDFFIGENVAVWGRPDDNSYWGDGWAV